MVGSHDHGNKRWGSIKHAEFNVPLIDYFICCLVNDAFLTP
jgi:hypothetical protein